MVASRKRKRSLIPASSERDYEGVDPPPFAPANLSTLKAYRGPVPRSITSGLSPLILNLMLVAGHRLKARDYASAAAVLPCLLKRYRKVKNHRWFFSREIAVTGVEVLRRSGIQYAELLDEFLAHVSRDGHLASHSGPEGYSTRTRESVLLERAMELLADGQVKSAYDAMYEQSMQPSFKASALVQGYLGVVALAASAKEQDPSQLLRVAANALNSASAIEPRAYFYVYYGAAAAIAAGRREDALDMLREFVNVKNESDPVGLFGVLSCLGNLSEKDTDRIRQERIDIARRLIRIDPVSKLAVDTLREAHAWAWQVTPQVDGVEMAEVIGSKLEHGESSIAASWADLGRTVVTLQSEERAMFWKLSGRCEWWPTHFFRPSRLNADIAIDPMLASVKGAIAKMLVFPEPSPYADGITASGVVDLFPFSQS